LDVWKGTLEVLAAAARLSPEGEVMKVSGVFWGVIGSVPISTNTFSSFSSSWKKSSPPSSLARAEMGPT
jgi:hypothetical protein